MKRLYGVFDKINQEFAQPFMLNNDDSAIDLFVKDVKSIARQNLAKFEELDISRYQLYKICDFDVVSGFVFPLCSSMDSEVPNSYNPILIFDVMSDFDFSEFDERLKENEKTKAMEVK